MEFSYSGFSCEADIYRNGDDIVVRFYNQEREHTDQQIVDLVVVDPGFGYMCLKFKGEYGGLLSGFLNERFFISDQMVKAAIDFVENLSPLSAKVYLPHQVVCFKPVSYVEYNGEY